MVLVAVVMGLIAFGVVDASNQSAARYGFYRSPGSAGAAGGAGGVGGAGAAGTRRVFGGAAASLRVFPAACALLDRYWAARCSCSVLAARWALTAAHCVSARVAYVTHDTRRVGAAAGDACDAAPVLYLYRHPGYRVVQEDEGRGPDVTQLQHDVGLVRTRSELRPATHLPATRAMPAMRAIHAMRAHRPPDLAGRRVQVLGFGRTEDSALGEELFVVELRLVACERGGWVHCVCGVGDPRGPDAARGRGVCSGDSGGPVLYRGDQVGVTSMGPVECSQAAASAGAGAGAEAALATATSVFTALYHYADVINATIHDTDAALRMRMIAAAPLAAPASHLVLASALFVIFPAR